MFGVFEELLWDILVWQEHFGFYINTNDTALLLLVPLLSVPQITHYILDGIIWKRSNKLSGFLY